MSWKQIKAILEGLMLAGLVMSIMGERIFSDPKWLFITIYVAGSFILDGIDEGKKGS